MPNYHDSVSSIERYSDADVMQASLRSGVFSEKEILSRQEILVENCSRTILIEAQVLAEMIRSQVLPVARGGNGSSGKRAESSRHCRRKR